MRSETKMFRIAFFLCKLKGVIAWDVQGFTGNAALLGQGKKLILTDGINDKLQEWPEHIWRIGGIDDPMN